MQFHMLTVAELVEMVAEIVLATTVEIERPCSASRSWILVGTHYCAASDFQHLKITVTCEVQEKPTGLAAWNHIAQVNCVDSNLPRFLDLELAGLGCYYSIKTLYLSN